MHKAIREWVAEKISPAVAEVSDCYSAGYRIEFFDKSDFRKIKFSIMVSAKRCPLSYVRSLNCHFLIRKVTDLSFTCCHNCRLLSY